MYAEMDCYYEGDGSSFSAPAHGGGRGKVIGNYILGQRIGSGSFAVVWKATHRRTGSVFAVKEIDKKHINLLNRHHTKNNKGGDGDGGDNLLKEISILSNIRHPNIIRLFEAIQTEDRIYLVLEYCGGGDLAGYIHRRGKVSHSVARHFITQLAAGLQVLNENHLIHRDLKPQNLLLSNNDATPLLKIGDFGFARYLTHGLADTLCGSPLYMAPEIILNKKYDGKADLWSAGAILFQLVTGKPPFNGDSQLQLFQNILMSGELQFPEDAQEELHPDCLDLCRSLLRLDPAERLTFEEFFNHKFLEKHIESNLKDSSTQEDGQILYRNDHASTSNNKRVQRLMLNAVCDMPRTCFEGEPFLSDQLKVTDSLEFIEREYVFVNAHFASSGNSSCSLETALPDSSAARVVNCLPLKMEVDVTGAVPTKDVVAVSTLGLESLRIHEPPPSSLTITTKIFSKVQGLCVLHPQTQLQLLSHYICCLSELAEGKFNAGLFLESFAVELVVLAVWKKALQVCSSWLASATEDKACQHYSDDKMGTSKRSSNSESVSVIDFSRAQSVSDWAEREFISAFDRAEKLSYLVKDIDGSEHMPDAVEIIFRGALELGKSGGVDELMGNKNNAAAAYSKARLLLTFILEEAESLQLNPGFSLSPEDIQRIRLYIANFEARESNFLLQQSAHK